MHFLDFFLQDNYLVPVRTFAIFSAANILSALFRFSTNNLFVQNLLLSIFQWHIFFYIFDFKETISSRYKHFDKHMFISAIEVNCNYFIPARTFFVNSLVADVFLNFWLEDNNFVPYELLKETFTAAHIDLRYLCYLALLYHRKNIVISNILKVHIFFLHFGLKYNYLVTVRLLT